MVSVEVAGRRIGPGHPTFVIAEAGVNHNGELDLAHRLVDAAADAGADAVKFQTFSTARLVSPEAPKAPYQLSDRADESQQAMLARLELGRTEHEELLAHCSERGLVFLSTPFDDESVALLDALGVAALKIASPDLVNPPLLERAAATGRPLLVSTGMATLDEVRAAVALVGGSPFVLLHCVSAYPADPAEANLRAMATLVDEFGVPVGFSDHTPGDAVAVTAVALGACVLEKHLTLDRALPGPDHAASLEPVAFAALVRGVRAAESALGDGVKRPTAGELANLRHVRRSVAAARDLPTGTRLERAMLLTLRPATGIPAARIGELIGRRTTRALRSGELLSDGDVE